MVKKIGITGNIASGKSQVENYISQLGYKVIDADKISHEILNRDKEVILQVKNIFRDENIFNPDNSVSRTKLAEIIFNYPEKKKEFEKIIHAKIKEKINEILNNTHNENFIFISAALLFEAKWENDFDKIIFISAPLNIRLDRLIKRNGYNKDYALKRIMAQECEEEKIKKSDYIIVNDSDLKTLEAKTKSVLENLLKVN